MGSAFPTAPKPRPRHTHNAWAQPCAANHPGGLSPHPYTAPTAWELSPLSSPPFRSATAFPGLSYSPSQRQLLAFNKKKGLRMTKEGLININSFLCGPPKPRGASLLSELAGALQDGTGSEEAERQLGPRPKVGLPNSQS